MLKIKNILSDKKKLYGLVCIGAVACVVLVLALNFASIEPQEEDSQETQQTQISTDQISGMGNLDFLSDSQKQTFVRSLSDYVKSLDKTWPCKIEIYKKRTEQNNTIEFYFQLSDDGTYHACLFDKSKESFTFYSKNEIEGITNKPSVKTSETQTNQEEKTTEDTSNAQNSQQKEQTQTQQSEPEVKSQPVNISNATALLNYIPEDQFLALPKIITQHLAQQGISADGQSTIIDLATITPSSVGVQFSGWIVDGQGTKQSLTIEYNTARRQFGIGINL